MNYTSAVLVVVLLAFAAFMVEADVSHILPTATAGGNGGKFNLDIFIVKSLQTYSYSLCGGQGQYNAIFINISCSAC